MRGRCRTMEERKLICKLGAMITDRVEIMTGLEKITKDSPEYIGLSSIVTDEMAEIALAMGRRKPTTPEKLAKKLKKDPAYIEEMLDKMAKIGLLEYDWETPDHHKQWFVPHFVIGCGEWTALHEVLERPGSDKCVYMFDQMTFMPLKTIGKFVPPGGAGVGMHAMPVEEAIPAHNESVPVEHLSHWLDKADGKFAILPCICRATARTQGDGCGDIEEECCITLGDMAIYSEETGLGHMATREEIEALLKRCEDNGYVHQINRVDGADKVNCICNCNLGSCRTIRTSQYFNTPNLSASAYRAHVDKDKCVACGKCADVCPAGAAKLGQKLCTKNGPVEYPKYIHANDHAWGEKNWNPNYREDNSVSCHESGTSPCKAACPAHIAVQGYLKMAAEGRYLDALKLIKQDNPFPAVCGSICNRRCEDACTRGKIDAPLAIDEIKKFVAAKELDEKTRYIPEKHYRKGNTNPYPEKIAVIGAGPAGLSCAFYLAQMGYENVTVFDRNPMPGGMLTLGIPSFRLEKNVVEAEIDVLREMGVKFECGVEIGKDKTIRQLRDEGYKGFYLAIGAQKSAKLGIPGEDSEHVLGGVDFLREVNLSKKPKIGKKVAVVGGGNVAMDVARTALRLGADVTVVYRRKESDMPADPMEVAEAKAEGVKFVFEHKPLSFTGTALECDKGEVPCDTVITAIGQVIDWGGLDTGAMEKGKKDAAVCDAVTYQTAQSDIFAGGDCVTGPNFAIDAIAAGREGAESLHRFVHPGQSLTVARNLRRYTELDKDNILLETACFDKPQRQAVQHDKKKLRTMHDDRLVFTEEMVKAEASRCLGCGVSVVDPEKCIGCGLCTTRCEFDAIHLTRDHPENSVLHNIDKMYLPIAKYAVQRAGKIAIRRMKDAAAK